MSEIKKDVLELITNLIEGSSFLLALIYTIGHIFIAMICTTAITGASLDLAATNAIIEPMINGVWFYILHKTYNKIILRKMTAKEHLYA